MTSRSRPDVVQISSSSRICSRIAPGSLRRSPNRTQNRSRIAPDLVQDRSSSRPAPGSVPGSAQEPPNQPNRRILPKCRQTTDFLDFLDFSDFTPKREISRFLAFPGVAQERFQGRPGDLYRPLITAKHFPNDRPNRGPIFRFLCMNPHETVIFCLFFWKNGFPEKRKMDHFVGKCTFGALFLCTFFHGNVKKCPRFSGNSRPVFQGSPKPRQTVDFKRF